MEKLFIKATSNFLIALTLATVVFVWIVAILVATLFGSGIESTAYSETSTARYWIGGIFIIPLLETFIVAAIMHTSSGVSVWRAGICGLVMGILHCSTAGWGAAGSYLGFFVNGLIFSGWRMRENCQWGFSAALIAHALHNFMTLALPDSVFTKLADFLR